MKKTVILVISLILIVSITLIAVIIYKQKNKFVVPSIENIKSIEIVPAKAGGGKRDELFFDMSKKEHLDMVNNILQWLQSGKIVSYGKGDIIYQGGTPTYLIINLKDGTTIQIQSAVDSNSTQISNGTMVQSQSVDGQITLYVSHMKNPIRELSPALKSFIDVGWKDFFNYNQQQLNKNM